MPRGGARVGAGRKKGGKNSPKGAKPVEVASEVVQDEVLDGSSEGELEKLDPLTYMLRIINDPLIESGRRDRMAVAAAPYMHGKIGEGGKKDGVQARAQRTSRGKFAPAAPPRLVSNRR